MNKLEPVVLASHRALIEPCASDQRDDALFVDEQGLELDNHPSCMRVSCGCRRALPLQTRFAQHIVAAYRALPPALALAAAYIAKGLASSSTSTGARPDCVRMGGDSASQRLTVDESAGLTKSAAPCTAPEQAYRLLKRHCRSSRLVN